MKLIMENWRAFVASPVSVRSSILLKEGKFLINEEDLLFENDKDPEALSLDELKKISPEALKKTYDEMLAGETESKVKSRIAKWDKIRAAEKKLQDELWDIEENEGIVSFFKNLAMKAFSTVFNTEYVSKYDLKKQELAQITKELRNIFKNSLTPLQREIFRAIQIFTGNHWSKVRNPEKVPDDFKREFTFLNDGLYNVFSATKESLKKARVILYKLTKTKLAKTTAVWRGLGVALKTGQFPGLDKYVVGNKLNVGQLISFSTNLETPFDFAAKETDVEAGLYPTVLHVPKLQTGVDVNEFSDYEDEEDEIMISGTFKIVDLGYSTSPENVKMGFKSFKDIAKEAGSRPGEYVIRVTLAEITK